jgi:hypothetical protein
VFSDVWKICSPAAPPASTGMVKARRKAAFFQKFSFERFELPEKT